MAAPIQRDGGSTARSLGLQLGMPANHTQGNMPYIAIATGSVDGAECVLRDMGISDTEFSDDNQTVNSGGYIHLYKGSANAGAEINASTPSETALMNGTSATPLNAYDMVMFPCQSNRHQPGDRDGRNQPAELRGGGRPHLCHPLQLCVAGSRRAV